MAARIIKVEPREEGRAVLITLRGGTTIVDRCTRIDIIGRTDDVAIDELVSAIVRRGWDAVELHGTHEFRRAAALRLAMLDPPVIVADTPLTEADQVAVERARQAAAPVLQPDSSKSFRM